MFFVLCPLFRVGPTAQKPPTHVIIKGAPFPFPHIAPPSSPPHGRCPVNRSGSPCLPRRAFPTRSARRPAPPSSPSSSGGPRCRGRRAKASGRSVLRLGRGPGGGEWGRSEQGSSRGTKIDQVKLRKLGAAFKKNGPVAAGNSSTISTVQ